MYTLNDGFMQIDSSSGSFPDAPAGYLGKSCGFGFADGHVESHRWVTATLLSPNVPYAMDQTGGYPTVAGGKNNRDWQWFAKHAACTPTQAPSD